MKKKPNPRPTIYDVCEEEGCNERYAETHEVFYGNPDAALSQIWGMTRRLCYYHHRRHKTGVHHNQPFREKMQAEYQRRFEKEHGHEKFIEIFKKNYL